MPVRLLAFMPHDCWWNSGDTGSHRKRGWIVWFPRPGCSSPTALAGERSPISLRPWSLSKPGTRSQRLLGRWPSSTLALQSPVGGMHGDRVERYLHLFSHSRSTLHIPKSLRHPVSWNYIGLNRSHNPARKRSADRKWRVTCPRIPAYPRPCCFVAGTEATSLTAPALTRSRSSGLPGPDILKLGNGPQV